MNVKVQSSQPPFWELEMDHDGLDHELDGFDDDDDGETGFSNDADFVENDDGDDDEDIVFDDNEEYEEFDEDNLEL